MKKNILIFIMLVVFTGLFSQNAKPDALALYREGKYAESIAICIQEIQENPKNLDSYAVLCWGLVSNHQYSEAEYWSTKGRSVSKYDPRLVEIQAEAKYYLGQNTEALALFQEYISLVPTSGSRYGAAYYYMGEIYIRQSKFNHADIAFSTAVKAEPLKDNWWTRLGYAREMAGNYSIALTAYEQALLLNPYRTEAKTGKERVSKFLQQ